MEVLKEVYPRVAEQSQKQRIAQVQMIQHHRQHQIK